MRQTQAEALRSRALALENHAIALAESGDVDKATIALAQFEAAKVLRDRLRRSGWGS